MEESRPAIERMKALANRPSASVLLSVIAFLESTVLFIPPDALLIPMSVMQRGRAFFYAALTTISSVSGGVVGYLIGAFFFQTAGALLIRLYGLEASLDRFHALYADYGVWIVLAGGFTPIPYKVITITSGVASMNLALFVMASLAGRGARFFLLAALCRWLGRDIEHSLQAMIARSGRFSSLLVISLLIIGATLLLIFSLAPLLR